MASDILHLEDLETTTIVVSSEDIEDDLSGVDETERDHDEIIGKTTERTKATAERNPTLFIGLGGTGLKALDALKRMMKKNHTNVSPGFAFLGFDSNRQEISGLKHLEDNVEAYAVTIEDPKEYYQRYKKEKWCQFITQKKWPFRGDFGAGRYRQVSRLCLMKNFNTIDQAISNALTDISPAAEKGHRLQLDVYIVTSLCGGAGSGAFIDLAVLLKDYANQYDADLTIIGLFVTGDVYKRFKQIERDAHQRMLANTYACIRDITYLQDPGSPHVLADGEPLVFSYPKRDIEIRNELFDLVLLIEGTNAHGHPSLLSADQLSHFLASVIYFMSNTPLWEDHKAIWVNESSGFNKTKENINGTPRCFSSIGYTRFLYPEKEFINYMVGDYNEKILLSYLYEVALKVPQDKINDPVFRSIPEFLKRQAKDYVKDGFEFADLQLSFTQELNDFRFKKDTINVTMEREVSNNDWENCFAKMQTAEENYIAQINKLKTTLVNARKRVIFAFKEYVEDLPSQMLEKNIGVKYYTDFLSFVRLELDAEEKIAVEKIGRNSEILSTDKSEWQDMKKELQAAHQAHNFFWKRQICRLLPDYSKEFSEYLNGKLDEVILLEIKNAFQEFDEIINSYMSRARKVITKFDQAKKMFRKHKARNYEQLKSIAGRKETYAKHSEFSIIDLKRLEEEQQMVFKKNDPRKKAFELFGKKEGKSDSFWTFLDSRYEAKHIVGYIHDNTKDLFGKYRMSLEDMVNELKLNKKVIMTEIEQFRQKCKAQWNLIEAAPGQSPSTTFKIATPPDFANSKDSPPSTSDRQVEMLTVEYAAPPQHIRMIKIWKENYNRELKEEPSLHTIIKAAHWSDVDIFAAEESALLAFAAGMAYGFIYELSQHEKKAIAGSMKARKDSRNFLFATGNNYWMMPFYPKESKPGKKVQSADIPELVKLGIGRENAFQEFSRNPDCTAEIVRWVDDRIAGLNMQEVVDDLTDYINGPLLKLTKQKNSTLARLAENEIRVLKDYIEMIESSRSPALAVD